MHWARRVFPFVAVAFGLAGAGLAATRRVEDPSRVFSLEVPGDWHVEAAKPGREGESAILARPSGGAATLRAFSGPRKAQSLDELARAALLDETKKHPGWKVPERETVVVHGLVGLRARRARPEESLAEEFLLVLTPRYHVVLWLQCPADEAGRYGEAFRGILESVRFTDAGPLTETKPEPRPEAKPEPEPKAPSPPQAVAMQEVKDPAGAFSLSVPGDWQAEQQPGHARATDPAHRVTLEVGAWPRTCRTLAEFADALITDSRKKVPSWQATSRQDVEVSGRKAVQLRASATVGGQAVVADYLLVLTEGHQIALALTCLLEESSRREAVRQQVLRGFRVR